MSVHSSDGHSERRRRRTRQRFAVIVAAGALVTVVVALEPDWAIPIGAGVAVAALLRDVLFAGRRRPDDP
ncbi:hypothetical protein [Bailinhaonella thermotolerans]|nr:hypothetical protein [Bailinhaonella thermotolerans]